MAPNNPRGTGSMSGLNYDRPAFKVRDAGGGERIRTIAEELQSSRKSRGRAEPKRCRGCRAIREVMDGACRACLADEQLIQSAKRKLNPKQSRKANAQGRLKSQEPSISNRDKAALNRQIGEARARIAERRARVAASQEPRRTKRPSAPASGSRSIRDLERVVEAARKELLLARTDWEKDLLRAKYARAQEELSRLQKLTGARRSLS